MTKNDFKNYALIIIATVIFTLVSMLPAGIFSIIFGALVAALIGYTVTKHHYLFVGVVCACVLFIYAAFSRDFLSAVSFALPLILSGMTLGICYNIKTSEFVSVGIMTGIHTLYILLNVKLLGQNGADYFTDTLSESMKSYSDVLSNLYPDQFTASDIQTMLSEVMSVMLKFMPSFIVIVCAIIALLMLYFFRKILKITKSDTAYCKPFSDWRADKSFSIVFILIALVSFFLPQRNYLADAVSNVVFVSVFVFYIFGLSLVDFLLSRKIKSKFSRRLILLLMITFLSGVPMFILVLIGVLDGITDIRAKITRNNLPKEE